MLALSIAAGVAVPAFAHAVDGGPWSDLPELAGLGAIAVCTRDRRRAAAFLEQTPCR